MRVKKGKCDEEIKIGDTGRTGTVACPAVIQKPGEALRTASVILGAGMEPGEGCLKLQQWERDPSTLRGSVGVSLSTLLFSS